MVSLASDRLALLRPSPVPGQGDAGRGLSGAVCQLRLRGGSSSQTACLIFVAVNISLIITSFHVLWGLELKLTGFSRYNFNIVTVDTFESNLGG